MTGILPGIVHVNRSVTGLTVTGVSSVTGALTVVNSKRYLQGTQSATEGDKRWSGHLKGWSLQLTKNDYQDFAKKMSMQTTQFVRFCHHWVMLWFTFSMSETEDKEAPSRTSGAVKARKSCWVTYSSVKEMLPEGMSRRDHGEMMKPIAAGSGKRKQTLKTFTGDTIRDQNR